MKNALKYILKDLAFFLVLTGISFILALVATFQVFPGRAMAIFRASVGIAVIFGPLLLLAASHSWDKWRAGQPRA